MQIFSFPPLRGHQPHSLILGSMPGQASLDANQYYAHPRNAFWPIMAELFAFEAALPYAARCGALTNAGVAVWDVLQACVRRGSLDSAIETDSEVANDIPALLQDQPGITRILFNGAKAETVFRKHLLPGLDQHQIKLQRLPSTSPAHAALCFADKLAAWRQSLSGQI